MEFGLSKRYRDATTKMHITYKNNKRITGTARYASLNTQMGMEQRRRDGLECLGFSLIYLAKGSLPWQGIREDDKTIKYKRIMEIKKSISTDLLCKGLPVEFANFIHYCRSLRYEDKPDYIMLRKSFIDLFYKSGFNAKFDYDWNILKLDFDALLDREYNEEDSKDEQENEDNKEPNIPNMKNLEEPLPKKEEPSLARYTSAPNHLKSPFLKPKKLPNLYITKKIKQIKENFLEKIKKDNEDDEEIPDENSAVIVRKFACAANCIYRINLINNKEKASRNKRRERNMSVDYGNTIVLHRNKTRDDICTQIRTKRLMTPRPSKQSIAVVKRKPVL